MPRGDRNRNWRSLALTVTAILIIGIMLDRYALGMNRYLRGLCVLSPWIVLFWWARRDGGTGRR